MTAPVTVTQADREAGERLTRLIMSLPISMDLVLVNATHELARHRQQAASASNAQIAELREAAEGVIAAHFRMAGADPMSHTALGRLHEALARATAPDAGGVEP